MDVSSVGSLSTALQQAKTGDAVGIAVMRKAMELQERTAMQLLEALPQATNNPAHLGQSVDIKV